MSFGTSKSKSSSSQISEANSQTYGTTIAPEQTGYLQNMWWLGQDKLLNSNNDQGMGAYNQGMNALGGQNMQQAFNTLGRMQNPGMDPMMGVYANQIGQNFREQIMPGLRGDAALAGGLGNSRAGIAQGLAGARAGQQLQDFGAQLYGANQDRAAQAAQAAGQLGMQQAGGYGSMGQFGMSIPWYNLQQQAGLLGSPVMKNLGGYSTQKNSATSSGSGSGFNIGL
jgi:hypothetical protein